jgi:hypothetical protein
MGVTSRAGTTYRSGALEFTPDFLDNQTEISTKAHLFE